MTAVNQSTWSEFVELVKGIVSDATNLKDKNTRKFTAKVNYCCVFCQNETEFSKLKTVIEQNGKLANETETGPVFVVQGIPTVAGMLRVLKIRKPDPSRKERGDADFAVNNYTEFKAKFLGFPGFKLIERPEFEMIELIDKKFDTRVYFSNPPVEDHSGIKEALQLNQKSKSG